MNAEIEPKAAVLNPPKRRIDRADKIACCLGCNFVIAIPVLCLLVLLKREYDIYKFIYSVEDITISSDGIISFKRKPIDSYHNIADSAVSYNNPQNAWFRDSNGFRIFSRSVAPDISNDQKKAYHAMVAAYQKRSPLPLITIKYNDIISYQGLETVIEGSNGYVRVAWHEGNDNMLVTNKVYAGSYLAEARKHVEYMKASQYVKSYQVDGIPYSRLGDKGLADMFTWDKKTSPAK